MKTIEVDFNDGNGPVPAHQHPNGGGWVADSATVEETAYVGPGAQVFGNARVFGNAEVSGDAQVFGNARVFGNAEVSGDAQVFGNAQVYGNAEVSGDAQVYGNARVYGNAYLHLGIRITPQIQSGDLWVNADGSETVRLGCWNGSISELRELSNSDNWPSGGDEAFRNRWRPSLLALADLCEAHLATWKWPKPNTSEQRRRLSWHKR